MSIKVPLYCGYPTRKTKAKWTPAPFFLNRITRFLTQNSYDDTTKPCIKMKAYQVSVEEGKYPQWWENRERHLVDWFMDIEGMNFDEAVDEAKIRLDKWNSPEQYSIHFHMYCNQNTLLGHDVLFSLMSGKKKAMYSLLRRIKARQIDMTQELSKNQDLWKQHFDTWYKRYTHGTTPDEHYWYTVELHKERDKHTMWRLNMNEYSWAYFKHVFTIPALKTIAPVQFEQHELSFSHIVIDRNHNSTAMQVKKESKEEEKSKQRNQRLRAPGILIRRSKYLDQELRDANVKL